MNARLIKKILIITTLASWFFGCQKDKEDPITVRDIDGNYYRIIKIGEMEWFAQNLKTTTFNDGSKIPCVTDGDEWTNLGTGAYCWYDNDETNAKTYGALYNWYAVNTGKLCPSGWRVPTDNDWTYLEGSIDWMYDISDPIWNDRGWRGFDVGKSLKSRNGWYNWDFKPHGNGTDDYGFSALPAGNRSYNHGSPFFFVKNIAVWWSADEVDEVYAWQRNLVFLYGSSSREFSRKNYGYSVRCVRDID